MRKLIVVGIVTLLVVWSCLEAAYRLGRASAFKDEIPCVTPDQVKSVSPRFVVQPPPHNAAPLVGTWRPYWHSERKT